MCTSSLKQAEEDVLGLFLRRPKNKTEKKARIVSGTKTRQVCSSTALQGFALGFRPLRLIAVFWQLDPKTEIQDMVNS